MDDLVLSEEEILWLLLEGEKNPQAKEYFLRDGTTSIPRSRVLEELTKLAPLSLLEKREIEELFSNEIGWQQAKVIFIEQLEKFLENSGLPPPTIQELKERYEEDKKNTLLRHEKHQPQGQNYQGQQNQEKKVVGGNISQEVPAEVVRDTPPAPVTGFLRRFIPRTPLKRVDESGHQAQSLPVEKKSAVTAIAEKVAAEKQAGEIKIGLKDIRRNPLIIFSLAKDAVKDSLAKLSPPTPLIEIPNQAGVTERPSSLFSKKPSVTDEPPSTAPDLNMKEPEQDLGKANLEAKTGPKIKPSKKTDALGLVTSVGSVTKKAGEVLAEAMGKFIVDKGKDAVSLLLIGGKTIERLLTEDSLGSMLAAILGIFGLVHGGPEEMVAGAVVGKVAGGLIEERFFSDQSYSSPLVNFSQEKKQDQSGGLISGALNLFNFGKTASTVGRAGSAVGAVGGAAGGVTAGGAGVASAAAAAAPVIIIVLIILLILIPLYIILNQQQNNQQSYEGPRVVVSVNSEVNKTSLPNSSNQFLKYKVTISSQAESEADIVVATKEILQKTNNTILPSPENIEAYPVKISPGSTTVINYQDYLVEESFNDSDLVFVVSVTAGEDTETSSSLTRIGSPPVNNDQPFGYPASGKIARWENISSHRGTFFNANGSRYWVTGGLDIINRGQNVPVYSTTNGQVIFSGFDYGADGYNCSSPIPIVSPFKKCAVGGAVIVKNGNYLVSYLHLKKDNLATGEVKKGDKIGYMFEEQLPTSDAPHVHYQVLLNGANIPFGSSVNTEGASCSPAKILPYLPSSEMQVAQDGSGPFVCR
jgi:murein DD-endopeptidase MepM/ murein hydrolase activator NlpD